MLPSQAVGIDLGTTYSSIAHLNEQGDPVTIANSEGELSTPSVVLFDKAGVVVGTPALNQSIVQPQRVVQNSKRFMGDAAKVWKIDDQSYTPVDIATLILKKLINDAQQKIGAFDRAVVTVPAQFGDTERRATVEAGRRAGLKRVDVINEPVAAALCHVLGTEGLWFTELAEEQRILIYDLGGGTFDLSLVKYTRNEVKVLVSSGDLQLGGIDWNRKLELAVAQQFHKEFKQDVLKDPVSRQALALEVEQVKRTLSARPKAALSIEHAGRRKTYQIEQSRFERLTRPLVVRTLEITQRMLKDNQLGWAHVDVVLTVGGASRMPMVREGLKKLSGRTLNTSLSPEQSIAHGAAYYAGMLLSNDKLAQSILSREAKQKLSQMRQHSVNARALGVLVRDPQTDRRMPRYLIRANTPLPVASTEVYGTVVKDQRQVRLYVLESGPSPDKPPVALGTCVIDDLPPQLPENSRIAVTISYDDSARVHVTAREERSGKQATAEIIRRENLLTNLETHQVSVQPPAAAKSQKASAQPDAGQAAAKPAATPRSTKRPQAAPALSSEQPVALCNRCGTPLDAKRRCPKCSSSEPVAIKAPAAPPRKPIVAGAAPAKAPQPVPKAVGSKPAPRAGQNRGGIKPQDTGSAGATSAKPNVKPLATKSQKPPATPSRPSAEAPPSLGETPERRDPDEEEFWRIVE